MPKVVLEGMNRLPGRLQDLILDAGMVVTHTQNNSGSNEVCVFLFARNNFIFLDTRFDGEKFHFTWQCSWKYDEKSWPDEIRSWQIGEKASSFFVFFKFMIQISVLVLYKNRELIFIKILPALNIGYVQKPLMLQNALKKKPETWNWWNAGILKTELEITEGYLYKH